ncbi:hypothetical protein SIAM614_20291 [Stappia aggregata IAM 12614]|uniref:DUF930 domain-containing protein n=1 Tax=Roseibium aggregatum (strain ATCC 25650 / DSM 13394 / JCM 20685 / NBRC 16684 / NCIMB 2208 / IAM 12614 / B1) TaxID=384765 RepID=A0NW35_ROSAI|nr:DUF930 domain-containing protein [Roseibium aggregatum]EAV43200.1 hypothetical protein SIAM614_20291 [Stappia aggregata IAM 12614] [Roseibium aggregatum IAM 12614]
MAITADMDRNVVGIEPADRRLFLWGLGVSAVLHALVALMLLEGVSGYTTQPLQDVVEVELLPPPPQEEQTPPVELPQPEPEQPEQEEVETPEQPEQPQQEQAEEAPPPPPPPPPADSEDLAETPEAPPEPSVLQEVTEFGEEDTGLQGEEETPPASAESTATEGEEQAAADAQTEDAQAGETDAGEGDGEGEGQQADAAETDAPQEEAPEDAQDTAAEDTADDTDDDGDAADETSDVAETPEQPDAVPAETAGTGAETDTSETGEKPAEDFGIVGPIATNKTPAPKPPKPVASPERNQGGGGQASGGSEGPPAGMLAARELYSRDILDDPQARTAMRGMSEGQRLNLLCMTELREQIASVSALPPELLPSFRPRGGNVLQPRIAAFRSLGRWFDVAFRCETDEGVTRVERFSFKIGKEIPQSQWLERGLTGF